MQPASLEHKRSIDLIMVFICPAMVFGMLIASLLAGNTGDPVRYLAWSALLVELLVLYLPARLFMNKRGGGKFFGINKISASEWIWALLLGVGMFFLMTALNAAMYILWDALKIPALSDNSLLYVGEGWRLIAAVFLVAVIPSYAEETLFRGALLFSWLPHHKTKAILHSALLFGLFHAQPMSLPPLFGMGVVLALISIETGSAYPAMAVHGMNNLIGLLLINPAGDQAAAEAIASSETATALLPVILLYTAVGVGLSLLCYRGLKHAAQKRRAALNLPPQMELNRKLTFHLPGTEKAPDLEGDFGEVVEKRKKPPRAKGAFASRIAVALTYVLLLLFNAFILAGPYLASLT